MRLRQMTDVFNIQTMCAVSEPHEIDFPWMIVSMIVSRVPRAGRPFIPSTYVARLNEISRVQTLH
jgi:hypothetical protein